MIAMVQHELMHEKRTDWTISLMIGYHFCESMEEIDDRRAAMITLKNSHIEKVEGNDNQSQLVINTGGSRKWYYNREYKIKQKKSSQI